MQNYAVSLEIRAHASKVGQNQANAWHLNAFCHSSAIPRRNSERKRGVPEAISIFCFFGLYIYCYLSLALCLCFILCNRPSAKCVLEFAWLYFYLLFSLLSLPFRFSLARLPPDGCAKCSNPTTIDDCSKRATAAQTETKTEREGETKTELKGDTELKIENSK